MEITTNRASLLAFATAAATLFLQVLVHRMVSGKLLNNYAFLVISLTMLGFAVSGSILTVALRTFLRKLPDAASASAALFVLSALLAAVLFYKTRTAAPFAVSRPSFVLGFFRWTPFALLFALPFTFAGLILGALLSAEHLSARRVYFFDLLGSAFGAMAVVPAIQLWGVEASLLGGCGALLAATFIVLRPRSPRVRGLGVLATGVLLLLAWKRDDFFRLTYPDGSILSGTTGIVTAVEHVAWDPLSRIEVSRILPPDPNTGRFGSLVGHDAAFLAQFRRMITQNGYAYTYAVEYDGDPRSLRGIDQTLYSGAYVARATERPRVAVIGVGGGFDILDALYFGAADITGIEVNRATYGILTRTYKEYFRRWVEDPRVHLVNEEGRQFLATTPLRFDVVQLSGVDSYSGTPGLAHVFSENYLYTAEAFDLYLARLSEQGVVNMMRLEFRPEREMLRALTTAVGALRRSGVATPADHIAMLTENGGSITSLLVKKTPFSPDERARLAAWAAVNRTFAVSASPEINAKGENAYQAFLGLGSPARERAFVAAYPFDIAPTDDNQPFFFRYSFWWHLFPSDPVIWANVPVMEMSLLLLAGLVGLVAASSVFVPLGMLARRGARSPRKWRYAFFFAGAGLGYLAIEVGLMQRFGLFLGHPNYALSVVLASLLFSSGLGSMWSGRIVTSVGGIRFVAYLVAACVLGEYLLVMPYLPRFLGLPLAARASLVFLLVAPIGVGLGTFVPTALESLKKDAPAFIPWAWGINGVFSVLAPLLSVAISMTFGISALLVAAVPVYLAVGFSLPEPARSL